MLSLSIYCADTLDAAQKLAAPMMVMMHRLVHGDINSPLESEEQAVQLMGGLPPASTVTDGRIPPRYLIGTPETILRDVQKIAAAFDVDEIMVQCISNNKANRLRCLELLADVFLLAP